MNWQILVTAPAQIRLHVAAVVLALLLAPLQLALPKGSPAHRTVGWAWVAAMGTICVSAFFILDRPTPPNIGGFSWLHLLAIFTIVMLWRAIAYARQGDVAKHRKSMLYLVFLALGLPLVVAFAVPGRIMNRLFFG
jgi:uncharacterized membrane protein